MASNRTVFIGNIPYGVSEDVITSTLERVGQVNHFRLVYDKETGKPKGFGFAEYADADQAAAAVRNLNEYELMGRKLRVDYSNDGQKDEHSGPSNAGAPPQQHILPANGQPMVKPGGGDIPPLPEGTGLGTHLTAQDAISQTVATIPPLQLLDAMQQMQNMSREEPEKAINILKGAPQLTYAITQILILMKLADQNTLASVIQQTAAQQATRPAPPATVQPPHPAYPPQYAPPPQQYAAPTPPVGMPYQPPPPQAAPPQAADPARDALIAQVMAMSQEQIDALAPNDRAQIMMLRQQLGGQYGR